MSRLRVAFSLMPPCVESPRYSCCTPLPPKKKKRPVASTGEARHRYESATERSADPREDGNRGGDRARHGAASALSGSPDRLPGGDGRDRAREARNFFGADSERACAAGRCGSGCGGADGIADEADLCPAPGNGTRICRRDQAAVRDCDGPGEDGGG